MSKFGAWQFGQRVTFQPAKIHKITGIGAKLGERMIASLER